MDNNDDVASFVHLANAAIQRSWERDDDSLSDDSTAFLSRYDEIREALQTRVQALEGLARAGLVTYPVEIASTVSSVDRYAADSAAVIPSGDRWYRHMQNIRRSEEVVEFLRFSEMALKGLMFIHPESRGPVGDLVVSDASFEFLMTNAPTYLGDENATDLSAANPNDDTHARTTTGIVLVGALTGDRTTVLYTVGNYEGTVVFMVKTNRILNITTKTYVQATHELTIESLDIDDEVVSDWKAEYAPDGDVLQIPLTVTPGGTIRVIASGGYGVDGELSGFTILPRTSSMLYTAGCNTTIDYIQANHDAPPGMYTPDRLAQLTVLNNIGFALMKSDAMSEARDEIVARYPDVLSANVNYLMPNYWFNTTFSSTHHRTVRAAYTVVWRVLATYWPIAIAQFIVL
jgi:hypothetical protein